MPGELEVPPLAADLRADENPRAVLLCKKRRVPVALQQRQILVKQGAFRTGRRAQFCQNLLRQLAGCTLLNGFMRLQLDMVTGFLRFLLNIFQ